MLTISRVTSRGARALDEHAADDQVGRLHRLGDVIGVGGHGRQAAVEYVLQKAQPLQVRVEDSHVGVHAQGNVGRIGADDAAANDDDIGPRHAGHAAQQHAPAKVRPLQIVGPDLHGHAPGDLAHGRQ